MGDVSTVTGTASVVTDTVSKGVAGAAGAVAGAVSKLVGKGEAPQARLEDAAGKDGEKGEGNPASAQQRTTAYVTYAPVEAEKPAPATDPAPSAESDSAAEKQPHKPKHAAPVSTPETAADGEENNA